MCRIEAIVVAGLVMSPKRIYSGGEASISLTEKWYILEEMSWPVLQACRSRKTRDWCNTWKRQNIEQMWNSEASPSFSSTHFPRQLPSPRQMLERQVYQLLLLFSYLFAYHCNMISNQKCETQSFNLDYISWLSGARWMFSICGG